MGESDLVKSWMHMDLAESFGFALNLAGVSHLPGELT